MRLRVTIPLLLLAVRVLADPPPDDLPALADAYLAQAALDHPEYRADVRRGGDPATLPSGRLFGVSPLLGPFTYRARSFDELTPAERESVLHDPAFSSFAAGAKGGAGFRRISLPPEEMLRPGPAIVTIAPRPDGS